MTIQQIANSYVNDYVADKSDSAINNIAPIVSNKLYTADEVTKYLVDIYKHGYLHGINHLRENIDNATALLHDRAHNNEDIVD